MMSNKTPLQQLAGATVVIKFGGHAMTNDALLNAFAQDIKLLLASTIRPIVVHGGGPQINRHLDALGLSSTFIDGARVTNSEVLEAVRMTLVGNVGRTLISHLAQHGVPAVGLSGEDGGLVQTKQADKKLGYVGQIQTVNPQLLTTLLQNQYVPVLAPLGLDASGQAFNHNADIFAAAIAVATKAVKTIFLTDVPGLLRDVKDPASFIPTLSCNELDLLTADGSISTGMIPKLEACQQVARNGSQAHIIDGRIAHSMQLLLNGVDIGTTIDSAESNS